MGMQRSEKKSAIRQGWVRPVRQEQAQGILIEVLGILATHFGCEKAVSASGFAGQEQAIRLAGRAPAGGRGRK